MANTVTALDLGPIQDITINDHVLSGIHVDHIIDSASFKKVEAYTRELGNVVLWEGDAYDAIGQWTDTDVANRLAELFPI